MAINIYGNGISALIAKEVLSNLGVKANLITSEKIEKYVPYTIFYIPNGKEKYLSNWADYADIRYVKYKFNGNIDWTPHPKEYYAKQNRQVPSVFENKPAQMVVDLRPYYKYLIKKWENEAIKNLDVFDLRAYAEEHPKDLFLNAHFTDVIFDIEDEFNYLAKNDEKSKHYLKVPDKTLIYDCDDNNIKRYDKEIIEYIFHEDWMDEPNSGIIKVKNYHGTVDINGAGTNLFNISRNTSKNRMQIIDVVNWIVDNISMIKRYE